MRKKDRGIILLSLETGKLYRCQGLEGKIIQKEVLMAPWLTKSAGESEEAVLARENSLKQLHRYYFQFCNLLDLAVLIFEKYACVEDGI